MQTLFIHDQGHLTTVQGREMVGLAKLYRYRPRGATGRLHRDGDC